MFRYFLNVTFKAYSSTCSCILVSAVGRRREQLKSEGDVFIWCHRNNHRHIDVCSIEGRGDGISRFPVDGNIFRFAGTRAGQKYLRRGV